MIKRIALFRFHKLNYEDHINRILFFKIINPSIPVYGLYGGDEMFFEEVAFKFKNICEEITLLRELSKKEKWLCSDIVVQQWYNKIGIYLNFDVLHVIEWDLVFMESLDRLYTHIPVSAIGCTGLKSVYMIEKSWYWTSAPIQRSEWLKLLTLVIKEYNYRNFPFAIQGPAICYPKSFLEKIKDIQIPRICNDELRIPLYAQILGFELVDNKFFKWFYNPNYIAFNCDKIPVKFDTIAKEVVKVNGYRVFHPYLDIFDLDLFVNIISAVPK